MARQLLCPGIGTKLTLAEDWMFDLHYESRNCTLYECLGIDYVAPSWSNRQGRANCGATTPVVLNKGTVLKVDRVYIRQHLSDFSSITFYVETWVDQGPTGKKKKKARFWAKLDDCNTMIVEE